MSPDPLGETLNQVSPSAPACWISEAVATPGRCGRPAASEASATSRENPGATVNLAPASAARSTRSTVDGARGDGGPQRGDRRVVLHRYLDEPDADVPRAVAHLDRAVDVETPQDRHQRQGRE
jgi:hypothetical protein